MKILELARALKKAGAAKDERREIIENENYMSEEDMNVSYDDALDQEGNIYIGSLEYYPSTVLQAVDPIAYRCGFSDHTDGYTEFYVNDDVYYTDGIA